MLAFLFFFKFSQPSIFSRHLLAQSQQPKHQNNVRNLFKVSNIDSRTTPMTSFWNLYCWFWADFTHCSGVPNVYFKQVNTGYEVPFWKARSKLVMLQSAWWHTIPLGMIHFTSTCRCQSHSEEGPLERQI